MQKSSFKTVAALSLFFFLATPSLAFAQGCSGGSCGAGSQGSSSSGGLFGGGGEGAGGLGAGLLIGQMLGSQGGGGGPAGQVGQVLSLVGALTGNMGLLIAGMITSMLGGLAGGATPQQGQVDEGYVGQGQGYGGGGGGGGNPYYPTPTPAVASHSPVPETSTCSASVFIVKDTTATPNVTKPYPSAVTIPQNNCVLAINSDTASHSVQVKKTGETTASVTQSVAASASHIFRFAAKNTYTLCVDGAATTCTSVTVQ